MSSEDVIASGPWTCDIDYEIRRTPSGGLRRFYVKNGVEVQSADDVEYHRHPSGTGGYYAFKAGPWKPKLAWEDVGTGMRMGVRDVWRVDGPKPFGSLRCTDEDDARTVCDELNRMYSPEPLLKMPPPTAEQIERMKAQMHRGPLLLLDRQTDEHAAKISDDWDALLRRAMARDEPRATVRQHIRYEVEGEVAFTWVREATLVKDDDGFHLEERRPEWYGPSRVG